MSPFVEVAGQRYHVQDTGGAKPAVVFSHGFLMDHEMFAPQVSALRDHYRVITWDIRCRGGGYQVSIRRPLGGSGREKLR
ncbi:hypothetical protein BH23ACT2_BH23ACT2_19340 [soil metagenome]